MNLQVIEKVAVGKKSFSPGACSQRDMRVGKESAQLSQSGDGHDRVSNPVGTADHNPLYWLSIEFTH
jgi:hypothetical protein